MPLPNFTRFFCRTFIKFIKDSPKPYFFGQDNKKENWQNQMVFEHQLLLINPLSTFSYKSIFYISSLTKGKKKSKTLFQPEKKFSAYVQQGNWFQIWIHFLSLSSFSIKWITTYLCEKFNLPFWYALGELKIGGVFLQT